jgi:hypothetical protein
MNSEQAKNILALFRPGTADRNDPGFQAALESARPYAPPAQGQDKPDPALARWFQDHCSSYLSIRDKFVNIPVPQGLEEKILAGVPPYDRRVVEFPTRVFLRAAAVLVLCVAVAALFWRSHGRQDDFRIYRSRMARTALQSYGMVKSHDLQMINLFFAAHDAPADYVLPEGIARARPVGCAVVQWQGRPVSMLCFRSGQPLPPGQESDLWLFVVDKSSVRNGPPARPPVIAQVNRLTTAAWSQDGKTYILAGAGDEEFLRKYF